MLCNKRTKTNKLERTNRLIAILRSSQLLTKDRRRKERDLIWFLKLIPDAALCLSTQCEGIRLFSCLCDGEDCTGKIPEILS